MITQAHRRLLVVLFLVLSLVLSAGNPPPKGIEKSVVGIDFLGMVTYDNTFSFGGTTVGGLSGIAYDVNHNVYYAISDDRTNSRFYELAIDISDGSLDPGDVTFLDVTFLKDQTGSSFPPGFLDPEDIDLPKEGQFYISSEGDAGAIPPIDPFVDRFNPIGKLTFALPIPDPFLPNLLGTKGVRNNLAFESLTSTPDAHTLFTATENALVQDGPISSLTTNSPSRMIQFDLDSKRPVAEYVYVVSPIPQAPVPPAGFADNGLVDLQALDNYGNMLALERSFAVGVGNTVRLYETTTQGATDVSGVQDLDNLSAFQPMPKQLIADFEQDLGVDPDNLEGMIFGPTLPDGRVVLIVVSDNNFNPSQTTQIIALAVTLD